MDYVIAKLKLGNVPERAQYQIMLSDITIYTLPDTLTDCVDYDASRMLEDGEWFKIPLFKDRDYSLSFLSNNIEIVLLSQLDQNDIDKLAFICAYQNNNEYYFQRVSKYQLLSKKRFYIGDEFSYEPNSKNITINTLPDAIYLRDKDTLYFKKLSSITSIFKGIDTLFRDATREETSNFLSSPFISLGDGFNAELVKQPNRKKITLALETLNSLGKSDIDRLIDDIKEYCPGLIFDGRVCKVKTDDDLKQLLYGLNERYFTTPVSGKKQIANSIIKL